MNGADLTRKQAKRLAADDEVAAAIRIAEHAERCETCRNTLVLFALVTWQHQAVPATGTLVPSLCHTGARLLHGYTRVAS